jgi:dihydroxyacetone kinase-like protein
VTGPELADWLREALASLVEACDELAQLDAAAGDGDLGLTVEGGARAAGDALAALPSNASPGEVVRASGLAFARANPSSFSALVGAGALAAALTLSDPARVDGASSLVAGRAAAAVMAERGRSAVGDRTVLDALVPSLDALADVVSSSRAQQLASMITAARSGVEQTASMVPRRGRAAWVGERAFGVPDAGATAYLRFLEALFGRP